MPFSAYPLFIPNLGIAELSVIFLIILILFGPGKLPEFCRALGDGIREFKNASKDSAKTPDQVASSESESDKTLS